MSHRVRVVAKIRPMLEEEGGQACCISRVDGEENSIYLHDPRGFGTETHKYEFDGVYDEHSTSKELFEKEISHMILPAFEGYNTTIFAYGITGSGKTHSMVGTPSEPGVIPRVLDLVFQQLEEAQKIETLVAGRKKPFSIHGSTYSVTMSFLQIYKEKLYDLLGTNPKDLSIREDASKQIFIQDLELKRVDSRAASEEAFRSALKRRKIGSTAMNASSSRSHSIMVLRIRHRHTEAPYPWVVGKIHLIDLAGSEDNRKTKNTGERLTESSNINMSLFALGKVINALNSGDSRIPYRDSKLTRMLQDSLGGSSRSLMLANIAPSFRTFYDTYHTLNYATKSRTIVNRVEVGFSSLSGHVDIEKEKRSTVERKMSSRFDRAKTMHEKLEEWRKMKRNSQDASVSISASASASHGHETRKHGLSGEKKKAKAVSSDKRKKRMKSAVPHGVLLSPKLRGHMDEEVVIRLEAVERTLKSMVVDQTLGRDVDGDVGHDGRGNDDSDIDTHNDKRILQSPPATISYVRFILPQAREFEKKGDWGRALVLYEMAFDKVQGHEKLKKKIEKLKEKIDLGGEKEGGKRMGGKKKTKTKTKTKEKHDTKSEMEKKNILSKECDSERILPKQLCFEDDDVAENADADEYDGDASADDEADLDWNEMDASVCTDDGDEYLESVKPKRKRRKRVSDSHVEKENAGSKADSAHAKPKTEAESGGQQVDEAIRKMYRENLLLLLRTGTLLEIKALKTIGPKRAEKIIEHRPSLSSLDDLVSVGVFSKKLLEKFIEQNMFSATFKG
eukprot:TRINITY_DN5174_c0_g3_i1.p1 TRINITY_DN5174_c0_g3~~TRINITY_DN5174_c0_g3_i1.p1  ORF type:complete len:805 (+),score=246.01 TRINITY_DN5174_c0_g3_i1:51-2417(+)